MRYVQNRTVGFRITAIVLSLGLLLNFFAPLIDTTSIFKVAHAAIAAPTTIDEVKSVISGTSLTLTATGERGCNDPCTARTDTLDVNMAGWIETITPRSVAVSYADPKMLGDTSQISPPFSTGDNTNGSSYFGQNGPYRWFYKRVLDTSLLPAGDYRFCVTGDGNAGTYLHLPAIPFDQCSGFSITSALPAPTCGSSEQTIMSTIGTPGTTTTGPINVKVKVSNAQSQGGVLSFHYEVYVDRQTSSFKAGFEVYQGRVPGNAGNIVITQAEQQTVVSSDGITTPVIQGDVNGSVNQADTHFDIDWHWKFAFKYNTFTGQQSSELPGGTTLALTSCATNNPPPTNPDFALSGTLPQTKYRGQTASFTVVATNCVNGFNGPVTNLRVDPATLPSGAGAVSFNPTQISSCDSGSNYTTLLIPLAAGTQLGTFIITILGDGSPGTRTTTAQLTVQSAPIASIAIQPKNSTILVGGKVDYTVTATMTDGSTADVTSSATYTTPDSNISLNNNTASGVASGSAQVTATYLSAANSDSAAIEVQDFALVCPVSQELYQGSNKALTFSITPQNGFNQDVGFVASAPVINPTPSSGNLSSPTYLQAVVVHGTSPGLYNLVFTATYSGSLGSKTTQCNVAVNVKPTLTGITLAPANTTIAINATQSYTTIASYSDGTTKDVSDTATYSVSNGAIATLSGKTATGKSAGTVQVTVTYTENGVIQTADASLTVSGIVSPPPGGGVNPPVLQAPVSLCTGMKLTWQHSGPPNADIFTIYRNGSQIKQGSAASFAAGGVFSYLDSATGLTAGPTYTYYIVAQASGVDSNPSNNQNASWISCDPNLDGSNKRVQSVAGVVNTYASGDPCDPTITKLDVTAKLDRPVDFVINICNSGNADLVIGNTSTTQLTIDDSQMTHLKKPNAGWGIKLSNTTCPLAPAWSSGAGNLANCQYTETANGFLVTLKNGTLGQGLSWPLTFTGVTTVPSSEKGNAFFYRNRALITYPKPDGSQATKTVDTGYKLFVRSSTDGPVLIEIPPGT